MDFKEWLNQLRAEVGSTTTAVDPSTHVPTPGELNRI